MKAAYILIGYLRDKPVKSVFMCERHRRKSCNVVSSIKANNELINFDSNFGFNYTIGIGCFSKNEENRIFVFEIVKIDPRV